MVKLSSKRDSWTCLSSSSAAGRAVVTLRMRLLHENKGKKKYTYDSLWRSIFIASKKKPVNLTKYFDLLQFSKPGHLKYGRYYCCCCSIPVLASVLKLYDLWYTSWIKQSSDLRKTTVQSFRTSGILQIERASAQTHAHTRARSHLSTYWCVRTHIVLI